MGQDFSSTGSVCVPLCSTLLGFLSLCMSGTLGRKGNLYGPLGKKGNSS